MADPEIHRNQTEARAGSTPHVARWILVISTTLIIVAFVIIYFVMQ